MAGTITQEDVKALDKVVFNDLAILPEIFKGIPSTGNQINIILLGPLVEMKREIEALKGVIRDLVEDRPQPKRTPSRDEKYPGVRPSANPLASPTQAPTAAQLPALARSERSLRQSEARKAWWERKRKEDAEKERMKREQGRIGEEV